METMIANTIQISELIEAKSKVDNTFIVYLAYWGPSYDDNPRDNEHPYIKEIQKNLPDVMMNDISLARYLYFEKRAYYSFNTEKDAWNFFKQINCNNSNYGVYAAIFAPTTGCISENT